MHHHYEDITSRIAEGPSWHDDNGAPRYGEFSPQRCPNIYSDTVVLARIACQYCHEEFLVEMHAGLFDWRVTAPPAKWHYGDPPVHGCVGDTMNCDDLEVVEAWHRERFGDWERRPEWEGIIDEADE